MAQEYNFFALLGDEEGDDVFELISRMKQEEQKKKNSSMEEDKVKREMKEEKKMAHQIPTDMRAKRLFHPSHVRRSFVVFDKKKEREKAEAEARRKAEVEAKAKGSVDSNGDSNANAAADDKTGEQTVKGNFKIASNNSNGRRSTTLNGGNYKYERNNARGNGYQQSNGYHEGKYRRANGYQVSYKGSNGNQRYDRENNGVSNGDQVSGGGDPSGNVTDDGWQYVGRRCRGNRSSTYQQHMTHEQDGIKHESLEESKSSEKDSRKSVSGDNNDDIAEKNDLTGEEAVENKEQGLLPVSSEGQEDTQSEKKEHEKMTNLMTLAEYEKKKHEDRKSLEAFKRCEQRKVEDKDFESMQLIGKKKEDNRIVTTRFSVFYMYQKKPEDKLKKKNNITEETVLKALSINGFLKPAEVKTSWQKRNSDRPNGNGYGKRPSGRRDDGYGERPAGHEHVCLTPPRFDFDHQQFPALTRENGKA